MKTYVINLVSGPSTGKTTLSALLFAHLKLKKYLVEYVQEYAKLLVWTKDYNTLNNQYYVSQKICELLRNIEGKVQFIITDGSILHGLYYNRHNKDNTSNIEKTERFILENYDTFNNITIFLERGDFEYEPQGRIQTEQESKEIDVILKHLLRINNIKYKEFKACGSSVEEMIEYILSCVD